MKIIINKTNVLINILKLLVALPIILVNALLIKIFDFYGIEYLITCVIYILIFWFFRVNRYKSEELNEGLINISISSNLFGHKVVKVKLKKLGINDSFRTTKKTYSYDNKLLEIAFDFSINDGKTECIVKVKKSI